MSYCIRFPRNTGKWKVGVWRAGFGEAEIRSGCVEDFSFQGESFQALFVSMNPWAAVWCAPTCELLASEGIAALGIEAYAPRSKEPVGAGRIVTSWLFPRYVFARLVEGWGEIKRVRGVAGIVSMAGEPCKLAEAAVAAWKASEDREGFIWLSEPEAEIKYFKGQRVRVTAGAFAGHVGVYKGMGARQREAILLTMMGRKMTVDLPLSDLAAA